MTERQLQSAQQVDKTPAFRFAVFSRRDGQPKYELESSFGDLEVAELMFTSQYSQWGIPDTTFYLADWQEQKMLKTFKAQPKEVS